MSALAVDSTHALGKQASRTEGGVAVQRPATRRDDQPGHPADTGRRWGLVGLVAVICLAVTLTLFLVTFRGYRRGELRVLALQTRLTADAIAAADPLYLQDHLGGAARLGAATGGLPRVFGTSMHDSVGRKGPYATASLWHVTGRSLHLMASTGGRPLLAPGSARLDAFLRRAAGSRTFVVTRMTAPHADRLGYAIAAAGAHGTFIAYAEQPLPVSHRMTEPSSSPIAQLNLAIYLGRSETPGALLETDADTPLPLRGVTYTSRIPFGDTTLTLTTSPRSALTGTATHLLPWAILGGGLLLTAAAALLTERLIRRRQAAERLTRRVSELYREQRSVAETLQRALLPQQMPVIPGIEIAVRYLPGTAGADVGGDWYDVVPLPDGRFVFLIGDVSGHGIPAAAVMAALHHASRAYALEGHPPAVILDRLRRLLDVQRDDHFATVICGLADVAAHQVVLASAGHLPPLLCDGHDARFTEVPPGPPVGLPAAAASAPAVLAVPPRGTLVCYTDGLVERRGESLDTGMKRLSVAAAHGFPTAECMLDGILADLIGDQPGDDIAVMGLRWLT